MNNRSHKKAKCHIRRTNKLHSKLLSKQRSYMKNLSHKKPKCHHAKKMKKLKSKILKTSRKIKSIRRHLKKKTSKRPCLDSKLHKFFKRGKRLSSRKKSYRKDSNRKSSCDKKNQRRLISKKRYNHQINTNTNMNLVGYSTNTCLPVSNLSKKKINKLRRRKYKKAKGCKMVEGCETDKNKDEVEDKEEGGESAFGKWGSALQTGSMGLESNVDYETMETREFYIDSQNIPIKKNDPDYYHSFQHRKLAKFFISKLLVKLAFNEESIEKCLLAPTATFAKILDIIFRKINYLSFKNLVKETDWNCPVINELPKKLKDIKTLENIKVFFNTHVKRIEQK